MQKRPAKKSAKPRQSKSTPKAVPERPAPAPKPHPKFHLKARNEAQKDFIALIQQSQLAVGCGPAGCGKTLIAVALAVEALQKREVQRIVITRPVVEAGGQKMGYLPGTLDEKVAPYLIPITEMLCDILGPAGLAGALKAGVIEVAPLAFMRGRNMNDAFVIIDEAQNTTPDLMYMAVTRLGETSRMVVTGDLEQNDLPRGQKSGLAYAMDAYSDVEGVGTFRFSAADVVRSALVGRLVSAHAEWKAKQ